ncbi:hypothetical protein SARC_15835, partial [Sphaeroforma arctica JP610]
MLKSLWIQTQDIHVTESDPYVRRLGVQLIGEMAKDCVHPNHYNELMAVLQKAAATCPPGTVNAPLTSVTSSPRGSKRSKTSRLSIIEDTITKLANRNTATPSGYNATSDSSTTGTNTPASERTGNDSDEGEMDV